MRLSDWSWKKYGSFWWVWIIMFPHYFQWSILQYVCFKSGWWPFSFLKFTKNCILDIKLLSYHLSVKFSKNSSKILQKFTAEQFCHFKNHYGKVSILRRNIHPWWEDAKVVYFYKEICHFLNDFWKIAIFTLHTQYVLIIK